MSEPPKTDDGHYVVINDRRWRATDPEIPQERRAELTRILMPWWEQTTGQRRERWETHVPAPST